MGVQNSRWFRYDSCWCQRIFCGVEKLNFIPATTLPKPPRLQPDGSGYDWREFDRWVQRLYLMLGVPNTVNENQNVLQELENLAIENGAIFVIDHQQEIRTLSGRIDDLENEMAAIFNSAIDINNLKTRLNEIAN